MKEYIIYDIEASDVDFNNKNEYGFYEPNNKEQIFSISYKGNDMTDAECLIIGKGDIHTEEDLLSSFVKIAGQYKLLIGHNSIKFDDVLFLDRMERLQVRSRPMKKLLKGDNRLDTMELSSLLNYGKPYGRSLKGLAKELNLPFTKENVNPVLAFKEGKFDDLAKYNNRDVELTESILLKTKALNMVDELIDLTGCKPKEVTRKYRILSAFLEKHKDEYPLQSNTDLEGKNKGGFNYRNTDKNVSYERYKDLIHIDVSSMYPSLMILIGANSGYDYPNYNIETGVILPFDKDVEEGTVSKMVSLFVRERRKIKDKMKQATSEEKKEELDRKQQAYKILANSVYGALDTDYFVLANRKLASLITELGRNVLKACIDEFESVYGKTDSIWISNDYTVEDVNRFVTKYLKVNYNLDNQDKLLRFELESDVDTLITVDKNDYVEILKDGTIKTKGSKFNPLSDSLSEFEFDISKKYCVNGESIDSIDDFIASKIDKPLSYFSKLEKLSEKELHLKKNNTKWLEANKYHFITGFSYNKVFTERGYIVFDQIEPKIPISKEYVKFLAYNQLYKLGLINDKPKKEYDKDYLPLLPVIPQQQKDGRYRFIPNKKLIAKSLDISNTNNFSGWEFYTNFNLSNIESEYQALLCHENTGYFFLDIDKNVDKWYRRLKKEFPIKTRHWTNTRSSKYHLVLKTNDTDIFKIKLNTDDVELKTNDLMPLNDNGEYGDYSSLKNTKPLKDINNIGYTNFVKKLQKVGLIDEEIQLKEPKKAINTDYLMELDDNILKNVNKWVEHAINLYTNNSEILSSNSYFMAIGNKLKQNITRADIKKVLESTKTKFKNVDLFNKTKTTALNKQDYDKGIHTCFKKDAYDKELWIVLKKHNDKLKDIASIPYKNEYGDEPFNIIDVLKDEFTDYTNKYNEIAYGLTNVLAMALFKQYRIILLTDEQNTGKSFYLNMMSEIIPTHLQTLDEYTGFTESSFRQLCKLDKQILNRKVLIITDTSESSIEQWLSIMGTLKPIMTQDNRNKNGKYKYAKSKTGGKGINIDEIYSKDGLLIFIANPKGFKMGLGGEERRASQLRLKKEDDETIITRLSDNLQTKHDPKDIKKRLQKLQKYINSIVNNKETPNIEINDKYIIQINDLVTDDPKYYKHLLRAFCILEHRKEVDDDVFERFLNVMQITKYKELNSAELEFIQWLISYYIAVEEKHFDGLNENTIRENHNYKIRKRANKTFTASNVKSSRRKKASMEYSDMLQVLADKNYLLRLCKNQKGYWIYSLNKTKLKEVSLLN